MTNKERIQANNAELREAIEIAENLPDAGGGGSADPVLQKGEATPTKAVQKFTPGTGYDGFSEFTVKAIPDEYVIPAGSVTITENGEHNVAGKAVAKVSVPIPDGYIKPSGELEISENGVYDVRDKETADVHVPDPVFINLNVTANGTYEPPDGIDGFKPVNVNVPIPDGYIKPSGSVEITENGDYDVTAYASVKVNVASGGGAPDNRALYQRVEYIESAVEGTYPYIITDFFADNTCGVEVIASFPVLQDRIPMGSRENSDATRFYCVYPLSASSIYHGFNTGVTTSCALKVNTIYRLQTNFLNSRLVCVYDEAGARKANVSLSVTLTKQTAPVAIFGYNSASSGTVTSKREYKLYSARCSKGHEVVREYIPCYRKSDGVVGVYEKFTGQFLTSETGAFANGAEVEWED